VYKYFLWLLRVVLMFISLFDVFKIGVGPSSSHTMGPMLAANHFLGLLRGGGLVEPGAGKLALVNCTLYGSLSFTGKGHATDRAVMLGLLDCRPDTIDPNAIDGMITELKNRKTLGLDGLETVQFDPEADVIFNYDGPLPGHANGMILRGYDERGVLYMEETYYSVGGGFIATASELEKSKSSLKAATVADVSLPYGFASANELLRLAEDSGLSIAKMQLANELTIRSESEVHKGIDDLIEVMMACIDRGLQQDGILPGGLNVKRRAKAIHEKLIFERGNNAQQPHTVNLWLSTYAMAVNEENAAGGKVITAPTNGAAGVIPAVLRYYKDQCIGATAQGMVTFMLTSAAIGGLIKRNASISGAEVGCQGEVGSAAAMAAAGLCAALGGSAAQVENAAEIALEHHLGMTCDPAGGLVQVPCIERNGLGAIKAVSAASLALSGDGSHFMPLDNCIETMRQTGRDMSEKYKETSQGGLAVNLPEC
jgi:L-serine dehydratase